MKCFKLAMKFWRVAESRIALVRSPTETRWVNFFFCARENLVAALIDKTSLCSHLAAQSWMNWTNELIARWLDRVFRIHYCAARVTCHFILLRLRVSEYRRLSKRQGRPPLLCHPTRNGDWRVWKLQSVSRCMPS